MKKSICLVVYCVDYWCFIGSLRCFNLLKSNMYIMGHMFVFVVYKLFVYRYIDVSNIYRTNTEVGK